MWQLTTRLATLGSGETARQPRLGCRSISAIDRAFTEVVLGKDTKVLSLGISATDKSRIGAEQGSEL